MILKEKKLIEQAVKHKKNVLGICLGAQLIAHVMGANVHKNKYREIGWFDIEISKAVNETILAGVFPSKPVFSIGMGILLIFQKGPYTLQKAKPV
jgi:GMP synthase-like glutamine amidotransferase